MSSSAPGQEGQAGLMKDAELDLLSNDALAAVFAYLNAAESIARRVVCRRWSKVAGLGCITLTTRRPAPNPTLRINQAAAQNIGSVTFSGRLGQPGSANGLTESSKDDQKPAATSTRRIRGHLPQAAVLTQEVDSAPNTTITFVSDRIRDFGPTGRMDRSEALEAGKIPALTTHHVPGCFQGAIRMEENSGSLMTIDLSTSSSTIEFCWRAQAGRDGPIFDEIIKPKKPRLFRSFLEQLNVSALRHLQQLSVRGCGNLEILLLPSSLRTLDAGGCSNLIRIDFPRGAGGSLKALDLGGCRRLRQYKYRAYRPRPGLLGPNTVAALKNVVDLDMSHVCQQGALDSICCDALRSTACLETFSLRYGATNEVITALAESESAQSGALRLVDAAFSPNLTDETVELLAKCAPNLERLNMRGCKKIGTSCYNHMPVYLERRCRRKEDEDTLEEDAFRTCTRKGDNLFYFCQKK